MEENPKRPSFIGNPYTFKPKVTDSQPLFNGFLRCAPLHRFSLKSVQLILSFASVRPTSFGFADEVTCVVNPVSLAKRIRSKSDGVTCYGATRGCRTLIIPGNVTSSSGNDDDDVNNSKKKNGGGTPAILGGKYDVLDFKLIEPLLKWNPNLETIFLHKDCEPMARDIGRALSKSKSLRTVVIPDWDDAVAIHSLVMPIRSVEVIDTGRVDGLEKNWANAVAIQHLNELIELHPKLQIIYANEMWFQEFRQATKDTRVKTIPVLVQKCGWARVFWLLTILAWTFIVFKFSYFFIGGIIGRRFFKTETQQNQLRRDQLAAISGTLIAVAFPLSERYFTAQIYGRAWTYWVQYLLMARRKLDRSLRM